MNVDDGQPQSPVPSQAYAQNSGISVGSPWTIYWVWNPKLGSPGRSDRLNTHPDITISASMILMQSLQAMVGPFSGTAITRVSLIAGA